MSDEQARGYYAASARRSEFFNRISGASRADVCVIGGGYTGLAAALHLAKAGTRVVLLEARTIGFGASGRNGGQIHSGHRKDQATLERWLGETHARRLWEIAEEGKYLVRSLIADHRIACELRDGLIIAAHDGKALRLLEEEHAHLEARYGYNRARMLTHAEIGAMIGAGTYPGGRFDSAGGHLHPLKYALGLGEAARSAGVTIFEHSKALAVTETPNGVIVRCDTGTVAAGRAIVACDAFAGDLLPSLSPYIGHVESFIIATEPLPAHLDAATLPVDAAVADTRHVLDYYRKSADRRLIFGGRESYLWAPENVAALVRPRMLRVFPALDQVRVDYGWSGTVGITVTRMPHFGRLGDRILFAHGYSGHGVALSAIGGKLLAEAALGVSERFDVLASLPAKRFPGGAILRRPLITAALVGLKLMDAF